MGSSLVHSLGCWKYDSAGTSCWFLWLQLVRIPQNPCIWIQPGASVLCPPTCLCVGQGFSRRRWNGPSLPGTESKQMRTFGRKHYVHSCYSTNCPPTSVQRWFHFRYSYFKLRLQSLVSRDTLLLLPRSVLVHLWQMIHFILKQYFSVLHLNNLFLPTSATVEPIGWVHRVGVGHEPTASK